MSAVLAELFVRTLVSLRKVLLPVSLEASVTKTESYFMGRGETFVVETFIWREKCPENANKLLTALLL